MSHHDSDDKAQMANNKTMRHVRSHHHHLSLRPAAVIDHLKTKVKQKRSSKADSIDLSDLASPNKTNGNITDNNSKRSSEDRGEFTFDIPLTSTSSQPIIPLPALSSTQSIDNNDIEHNDENNVFIRKEEQDSVVLDDLNEDDDISESPPWQTNQVVPDMSQKITKPKRKLLKSTKSLPETNSQSSVKKRRQTLRRTGFQIRDEDFSSIFSDLPSDEQLIIAYPCAWRRDVFMHGRLFLSVNYLCFYTCFFKWEESICIAYKDIVSVTRENAVKLLPNAIKLRTNNREQYVFASYIPRERIFVAIFRLWQNALLEQPLDYQQLRALVYADQQSHEESSGDSEESIALENSAERSSESQPYSQSFPMISYHSPEVITRPKPAEKSRRRVVSLSPETETGKYPSSCTCESHLSKTHCDRLFTFNVNTLFELIAGDNSFTRAFHKSQKLTDYTYGEWRLNNETGKRERQVTYKTITQSILGTNTLSCQEKQILEVEKPNWMYVMNIEVRNEGMKYTDAFYVATRFCMVQRDAEHSSLKASAEIRYIKSVNGFIKSFIEKNANSSIEGGINEQVQRLENQQVTQGNHKSNRKSLSAYKQNGGNSTDRNTPQHRTEDNLSVNSIDSSESKLSIKEKSFTGKGIFYDVGLFVGIFLLLLHVYLCYKLYSIDQILSLSDTMRLNQRTQACLENNISR